MLARVSITSTAPKRGTIEDYNGPKAVRDHGRVATREKNSAAGDEGTHSCHPLFREHDLNDAATIDVSHIPFPVDSGFDLPDSRAADATPSRPKVHITATLAGGLIVSSGEAEITP